MSETGRTPPPPSPPQPAAVSMGLGSGSGVVGFVAGGVSEGPASTDPNLRPARQTEKLGGKTIEGVYAEGTRSTITYPTGYMGNDRPIVVTHESWRSPDLGLIVLDINDDPRNGTRTTELTNIDRAEPDPALFQVPEGYTIKDQYPGSN